MSCSGDRHTEAPAGIFGGMAGLPGALTKNPGTPNEESWPSKITGYRMKAGDVVQFTGPSAGGYGDPVKRDPERVLEDWLDGFVTLDGARDLYRVAIDPLSRSIDRATTASLRAGA
jgi:N-methylhydantoinase B/oxoprolinase/acetone carboxylase alpha subunit